MNIQQSFHNGASLYIGSPQTLRDNSFVTAVEINASDGSYATINIHHVGELRVALAPLAGAVEGRE